MPEALQLCPNDYPPFAAVCEGHARALAENGYRARTVFFESRGPSPSGFDFVHAPAHALQGLVGDRRPDLVVSHRYRAYQAGLRLARRLSIPRHIAVAHEFGMFERFTRRLRHRLAGAGHARFAGVSNAVAEDLRRAGVDSPVVLPNTINPDSVRDALKSREEARSALGVPTQAFAIGVVGRLHPKKDPLRALGAFERYRRRDASACLVFVGEGRLRAGLEASEVAGVVFAGFRTSVRALLGAFDVLLACSTEQEAFGVVLLEAMAAGVPVVLADRPGPRSVVGDCGRYFTTDDELVEALGDVRGADPAPYRDAAAQRISAMFSVAALAQRYGEVLLASPG